MLSKDELLQAMARGIAPRAWTAWDERAKRKEFTADELPAEYAEWMADHPDGAMARSFEKAQAALTAIIEAGFAVVPREASEGMCEAGEIALADMGVDDIEPRDAPACYTAMIQAGEIKP